MHNVSILAYPSNDPHARATVAVVIFVSKPIFGEKYVMHSGNDWNSANNNFPGASYFSRPAETRNKMMLI